MSNFLALGTVTAVLRGLLEDSVTRHDLAAVLGATPEVSALPPDRIEAGAGTPDRINLFLFQATENAAWRNQDMPSRGGGGARLSNPRLALDLYYLVTAYGSADFRGEVLLGHAMHVFHETPVLTRRAIGEALSGLPAGALADALAASRLAEQFEQIQVVPRVLSVEEMSKIWTSLQSQYRPTVAYHVSVVLIEAQHPTGSALPVLTRGRPVAATGGDEGVFVQADLRPPVPTLEGLELPAGAPAVRMGETVILRGHHLGGVTVGARLRGLRGTLVLELPGSGGTEGAFEIEVPPDPPAGPVPPGSPLDPASWRAGVYEVSALVDDGAQTRESNRLPLLLAPRLDSIELDPPAGVPVAIEVACSPPVQAGQTVGLLVGGRELAAEAFGAPAGTLRFPLPTGTGALAAGPHWVRLRVDGIESLIVDHAATPPTFVASQSVSLP